jgi:predicted chitinase
MATAASAPAKEQNVQSNLRGIVDAMVKIGITDPNYIKALLGNVMKESAGKVVNEDIMGWAKTANDRIRNYFGKRVGHLSDEQLTALKGNKASFLETFSEIIYGMNTDIGKGMDNLEPGDGYRYRGRGFIQLTGKKNYRAASKALYGDDRLVQNPDLVNDPSVAAPVVAWYMKEGKDRMAKRLGFGSGPLDAEQARILTTSQIAGSDIRKKTIADEILGKVAKHQGQMDGVVPAQFQAKNGGIIPALPGGSTVLAGEAGQNEAVVPLPDGKSIPIETARNTEQMDVMFAQLGKMDELIRIMQNQLGVSEKLLKYAQ